MSETELCFKLMKTAMSEAELCFMLIKEIGEEADIDLLDLIKDKAGFDFFKGTFASKISEEGDEHYQLTETAAEPAAEAAAEPASEAAAAAPAATAPAAGRRITLAGNDPRPTTLYRITNGFATMYDKAPVEMRLHASFASQTEAFGALVEMYGGERTASSRSTLWQMYHNGSYIYPFLYKYDIKKVYKANKREPKYGAMGNIGGYKIPMGAGTPQYVVVVDDHEDHPKQRFPWGAKFIKPM